VTPKTGKVIAVKQVADEDNLVLITGSGQIIRIQVADLRVIGRSTQGVKLMDLEGEDRLVAVAKVAERESDAETNGGAADADAGIAPEPPPEEVN